MYDRMVVLTSAYSRCLLVTVAVLALLWGLSSAARSQTRCTPEGDPSACADAERGDIDRAPDPRLPFEPRRRWPGRFGDSTRDGWMGDGPRFSTPDGRLCWEHGDHVHCR
jgi:hypothetical protein